ncbi:hypothetical protein [Polymorphum gilvum]|uniref:RND transporter n=1 Tax=Polymorphum gilvum (strain LMG 25793 / CGMCC 1.9160 / SL003B-26A1) TaxID=991905 RepID=F2IUX0_POLGS|nr:hypothetical protein [Polymorphum gilvum]ADZ70199.1 hypothetical protein SL003B_1772 [Polymorphum gilvum SL003B-26A1]
MLEFLDKIPLAGLALVAFVLGLAPFYPEPHLVEKLRMLVQGQLRKPIDIFDLLWHSWPLVLVVLKLVRMRQTGAL